MKSIILLAVLCALPAFFARAPAAQAQSSKDRHTEAEVRQLNAEEVTAFLNKDSKTLARLWSNDFVVTNPLNRFVTKQQVLGMMESGFLVIASNQRQIEYFRVYGNTVIVVGSETVLWGGKMPNAEKRNTCVSRVFG